NEMANSNLLAIPINVSGGGAGVDGTPVFSATTGIVAGTTIELNTLSGGVTQAANRDLGAQNLLLRGASAYTLANAGNNVATLAADTGGGAIHYVDADALTVGNVTTVSTPSSPISGIQRSGDVALRTLSGDLTLDAQLSGANVRLQAANDIVQSAGTLTADALGARAGGNVLLGSLGNSVSTFSAAAGGNVLFGEVNGYAVGTLANSSANVSGGGAGVDGTPVFSATTGIVAGTTIELNTLSGGVTQAANRDLGAQNLALRGTAAYTLTNEGNSVNTLAASTGGVADGVLRYVDQDALSIGSVTPVTGGPAVNGITRNNDVGLRTVAGNLTLNESVDVSSAAGKNIELELSQAGSALTQAAGKNVLTSASGGLLLRGPGGVTLTNETNDVGLLAASGGAGDGVLRYTDANALAVSTVAPVAGGTAVAGITRSNDLGLRTVAGNLTINESIDVRSGAGKNIEFELTQADSVLTQTAGKNLLTSASGGLLLRGPGSVALTNETNDVGLLAASSGGGTDGVLRYTDANTLAVGSITPAAGGTAVAGITRSNDVGLRTVAGNLALNESIDVRSGAGRNIELELSQADSALSQAADKNVLTSASGGLLLRGPGSVTLTNKTNDVGLIAASGGSTDGALSYADANALAVGSITPVAGGTVVAGITRNRNVGLSTVAGDLRLTETIDVGTTGKAALDVGGKLVMANFKSVGELKATATGAVTFEGNFTAAGSGKTVDITSTLAANADADLRAREIDLFITGRKLGTTDSVWTPEGMPDPVKGGTLINIAQETIKQVSGIVTVDQGTALRLSSISDKPGSITLSSYDNVLNGQIAARSARTPAGVTELAAADNRILSRIEINGNSIHLGDSGATVNVSGFKDNLKVGLEADLVRLGAEAITTGDHYIVARYRATSLAPFEYQLPGLVIGMRSPEKYVQDQSFGAIGDREGSALGEGPGLKVVLGYDANLPESIGWAVLVPGDFKTSPTEHNGGSQEALAAFRARAARVSFSGPVEARPKYTFSAPGVEVNVPVFYNGQTPLNPAQRGALSAIVGLQEKLRREQLERAVSTENVARDLREGVIVEVGAGSAATTGNQGIREPEACAPAAGAMSCGPAK
ncbi:MAG: hypothetical protein JNL87_08870, partial [Burkholderiaceae bacterium]|nr:hypothetical protein [Burkholderiaceae bacterium]